LTRQVGLATGNEFMYGTAAWVVILSLGRLPAELTWGFGLERASVLPKNARGALSLNGAFDSSASAATSASPSQL
jgi:hypothetical protein